MAVKLIRPPVGTDTSITWAGPDGTLWEHDTDIGWHVVCGADTRGPKGWDDLSPPAKGCLTAVISCLCGIMMTATFVLCRYLLGMVP